MISTLDKLFDKINENVKKEIKLDKLDDILSQCQGKDWTNYANVSDVCYKRTLVKRNDLIEIIVIGWNIKQKSPIHDHPENGCLVKILKGSLTESTFDDKLKLIKSQKLEKNGISYQESNKILHKIENLTNNPAFSLHIYSPPNHKTKYYSPGCRH